MATPSISSSVTAVEKCSIVLLCIDKNGDIDDDWTSSFYSWKGYHLVSPYQSSIMGLGWVSNHELWEHVCQTICSLWIVNDYVGLLFRPTKKLTLNLLAFHCRLGSKWWDSFRIETSLWKRHQHVAMVTMRVWFSHSWSCHCGYMGFCSSWTQTVSITTSIHRDVVTNRLIVDQLRNTNLSH